MPKPLSYLEPTEAKLFRNYESQSVCIPAAAKAYLSSRIIGKPVPAILNAT